jgi:hypothetical protein
MKAYKKKLRNFLNKLRKTRKLLLKQTKNQSLVMHSNFESKIMELWKVEKRNFLRKLDDTFSRDHIIIAPWLGEIGYEVLYWIPFLVKMKETGRLTNAKITVISRGGVSAWYQEVSSEYIEIYDYLTPTAFEEIKSNRIKRVGTQKLSVLDNESEKEILKTIFPNIDSFENVLYPSDFFYPTRALFSQLGRVAPFKMASDLLSTNPYFGVDSEMNSLIPDSPYICVKFYKRTSFEVSEEVMKALIDSLLLFAHKKGYRIIDLDSGSDLDLQHASFKESSKLLTSQSIFDSQPSNNLSWQSALIKNSKLFIGTYGGPSYLPMMFNVPTIALITSRKGLNPIHERVVQHFLGPKEKIGWHIFYVDEFLEILKII